MRAAEAQHPGAFIAATDYTYASQLAFQLQNVDVTAFGQLPSQYDFWWDAAKHQGQDAVILADRSAKIDLASSHFRSVTKLKDIPVERSGRVVWTFALYLAEDYGQDGAN